MPVECWAGWYSNPDLCDVVAVLQQLSYQANWVVIIMWVGYRPVDSGYMHFLVHREDLGDVIDISRIPTIYCLIIDTHHDQLPVGRIAQVVDHFVHRIGQASLSLLEKKKSAKFIKIKIVSIRSLNEI